MWITPTEAGSGSTRKASRSELLIGSVMLAGAVAIFPTVGIWPKGFFVFARATAFTLSIICVGWSLKYHYRRWLIAALCGLVIFNPVIKFFEDESWDAFGIIFSIAFFSFGYRLIDTKAARLISHAFALIGIFLFALTYYVNHYMPRGNMHPTGDIVCMNDGRGPCGESQIEDLSELDIPDWAKFLRSNLMWTVLFFGISTIVLANKPAELRDSNDGSDL